MSQNQLNFCNQYSVIAGLSDAKTEFDKQQFQKYCQWSSSMQPQLGPMSEYQGVLPQKQGILPPKFSTLGNAYNFSGNIGPTVMDRNYRKQ